MGFVHSSVYFFETAKQMAKKKSAWMKHLLKEFRKNKKGGLCAAIKRAKRTYKKCS